MLTHKLRRRDFLRLTGVAGGAALLAACLPPAGPAEPAGSSAPAVALPATRNAEELLKAAGVPLPGSPNHPKGWRTLLPDVPEGYPLAQRITITTARPTDSEVVFPPGDDLDNNVWTRMIATLFGIQFVNKMTWVEGDEQAQKYNLAMASNDLADIMQDVPANIFAQMVEADMLLELGPIWDQYASPKWKDAVARGGASAWRGCTINGKRYAIPHAQSAGHDDAILWVRKDWLDRLGLNPPETWQDVHDVAVAFAQAKLGGPDTYGLLANKDFRKSWYGSLDPLWTGYGIVPNWTSFGWSEDANGNLRYDGVRPEVKEVLAILRQWYADGVFRKDFYAIGPDELTPDLASGRCGLQFNPVWGANRDSIQNTGAEWLFLDVPAGPKGRFKHTDDPWNNGRFCCPKNFQYAKEWIEMTNWRIELEEAVGTRMHGWEGIDYAINEQGEYEDLDPYYSFWTVGPIGTRTGGVIDPHFEAEELNHNLEAWGRLAPAERDAFQAAMFGDPVLELRNRAKAFILQKNSTQGVSDKFTGLPTPTMLSVWSDLIDQESEVCLSIITGQKSMEAFDAYVANWKANGGEQITAEVNEWWQKVK
ncbi:MAG TPA: hypothetical protein DCL15_16135 [Chloroflexi bacterium]|nr:hypothetical protein [Chloroflexota bacterium]HHW86702.1 extracellular solute-binding protein [Chloroflexota bacterium]